MIFLASDFSGIILWIQSLISAAVFVIGILLLFFLRRWPWAARTCFLLCILLFAAAAIFERRGDLYEKPGGTGSLLLTGSPALLALLFLLLSFRFPPSRWRR